MPDWGPSLKLSWGGHIFGSQSWSVGQWVALNLAGIDLTQAQLDNILATMTAPLTTWWNAIKLRESTDTQWDNTAMYYYPNHTSRASLVSRVPIAAIAGTGAQRGPATGSIVCSLRTTTPGRSGRGRAYVPITAPPTIVAGHQYQLSDCTAFANAHAALLTAINAVSWVPNGVTTQFCCVNSSRNAASYRVTRVVCDSIPDAQDRRQDKMFAQNVVSTNV